jgi:hypothetical protein
MHAIRTSFFGLAFVALAAAPATAQDSHKSHDVDLGFLRVSSDVDMKELGLPAYPGAHRHVEDKDDSSSADVWAGLGWFGLKLVVVELDSADAPDKVAAFYRPMLGKFGTVVDCASAAPAATKDDLLDCKNDHPKPGDVLFKAGNKHAVHIVGVERQGKGSKIALVFVELRGTEH